MANRDGFSLVELAVVVVVVGILAGFAMSRADVERARVDNSAQELALAMGAAQRQATLRQHDMIVRIVEPGSRISIHGDANNNGVVDGSETVRAVTMEEGVTFGRGAAPAGILGVPSVTFVQTRDGLPALTFHRNGSASEYGGFYLVSGSGNAEYARALEVTRSTGLVRCHSFRTGSWEPSC